MPNGPYVLRSPPNLFDNHLERRKLPRLQTGEVRRIHLLRPSEKSRRASCWSLRTRQNGSKKLYFSAEYQLNRGATDYSRPFSDGLSRLDFSHLRIRGIDSLLILPHSKRSSRCIPPADHGYKALGSLLATSLKTRVPTRPPFTRGLFACRSPTAIRKKSQGLCRRPNRCALLDCQMAKVEL
jgi:hypothetical protein